MASDAPNSLPVPFTRLITTHGPSTSPSATETTSAGGSTPPTTYHPLSGEAAWQRIAPGLHFSLVYSSEAVPTLNGEGDVARHEARLDAGQTGLVYPGGSVCRFVEWAPRNPDAAADDSGFMHRTRSLDYGVVVLGEVELAIPNEPVRRMKVGDVCVQRGTLHSWRNASTSVPARMMFVLIAADGVAGENGEQLADVTPPLHKGEKSEEVMKARRT